VFVHVAGAGAAGSALALALRRAGWPLGFIARRTLERARERCQEVGGGTPVSLDELPAQLAQAPPDAAALLLLAVPDRLLAEQAAALARARWPSGSVALHLSGAEEVAVLAPLARAGLATGGLHPLKSFVDLQAGADLRGTLCALDGMPEALALAERLASAVGARTFVLRPGGRSSYHAAAAHVANHLVALLDQALDLLARAGLGREAGRAALLPLLAGTVENLRRHPPGEALTGPVVRGDEQVVARHLSALAALPPDVGAAYRSLAVRALDLARRDRQLDPAVADRLLALLRGPPP